MDLTDAQIAWLQKNRSMSAGSDSAPPTSAPQVSAMAGSPQPTSAPSAQATPAPASAPATPPMSAPATSAPAAQGPDQSGQLAMSLVGLASGPPLGPDPCDDLLQQIIAILDELAKRLQDGENDPHNLYNNFRKLKDAHPEWGSWDGHRQKFYEVRDDLRRTLAEWEEKGCGSPRKNQQEQDDLNEAYEFKDKEFPDKPLKPMKRESDPVEQTQPAQATDNGITIEKVLEVLAVLGLSLALAATIVVALADPEPVSKLGLAGLSAAEITELMTLLGLGAKLAQ
jgi:hypothetical protein